MRYKLVLFDFDGTLMDTSPGVLSCGRIAMEDLGFSIPENQDWSPFIGPPLMDCFRLTFGINDNNILKQLCVEYRKHYVEYGYKQAFFYEGTVETLEKLRKLGYIVGIASMKNSVLIKKMNDYFGITKLIDCLEGQDINETIQKDEIILKLCNKYNIEPSQCVLVGDTHYDSEGAQKAGIDCIKVNYGFGFKVGQEGTVSSMKEVFEEIIKKQ